MSVSVSSIPSPKKIQDDFSSCLKVCLSVYSRYLVLTFSVSWGRGRDHKPTGRGLCLVSKTLRTGNINCAHFHIDLSDLSKILQQAKHPVIPNHAASARRSSAGATFAFPKASSSSSSGSSLRYEGPVGFALASPYIIFPPSFLKASRRSAAVTAFRHPQPPPAFIRGLFPAATGFSGRWRCCFAASICWQKCRCLHRRAQAQNRKGRRGKRWRERRAFRAPPATARLAGRRKHARVFVAESSHLTSVSNLIIVFHEPESPVLDYHQQAMLHHRTDSIFKLSRVRNKTFLRFFFLYLSSAFN